MSETPTGNTAAADRSPFGGLAQLFIGGHWQGAISGGRFELDAARLIRSGAVQVSDAVAAAVAAWSAWPESILPQRRKRLNRAVDLLQSRVSDFTVAMTVETGATPLRVQRNVVLSLQTQPRHYPFQAHTFTA